MSIRARGVLLAFCVLLVLSPHVWAQPSASIFTNPAVTFTQLKRLVLLGFTTEQQNVQDPFAAIKAQILLESVLKSRGLRTIEFAEIARRVQEDTGRDFSGPVSEENLRVFLAELPKHVDALFVGRISAWGTFPYTGTQVLPIPVYGSVYGPGGFSWQATTYVPVQRTSDMTVIGGTVALFQVQATSGPLLAWQYSHVRADRGGPFIWNRPPPADKLAEQFFQDVVKAVPLSP